MKNKVMITEDYVSFEIAKLLNEKGFDGECDYYYPEDGGEMQQLLLDELYYRNEDFIKCPTLQMTTKWLREVHNIFIELSAGETNGKTWYDFDIIPINGREIAWNHYNNLPIIECNSYEEAVEEALKYSLENLI